MEIYETVDDDNVFLGSRETEKTFVEHGLDACMDGCV